ncbi:MAG: repair protein SbcC/Rad50 [Candidatus Woesearchaeota archaeon]|nr:repair protein SbcC/Rad50 [Candidatus Woesearchaeota archaeon]
MIIKEVTLRNIRSYVKANISFPEGKVLLSGDIGAGKSSILLAAEFALFGLIRGSLNGASLLRNGSNSGSVSLKFECQNKEYIIKRSLKRNGNSIAQSNGYIIEDGIKYELSPIELKSKILQILGYSESLVSSYKTLFFRYTVYTPQEQMREILYMNPEERKDIIRKLFQLDKYKHVLENSDILKKYLREKRKELEGYASDLEEKKEEKNETNEKINEMLRQEKELEKQLESIKPKLLEFETVEKELSSIESKNSELNTKYEYILKAIEQNKKKKKDIDKQSQSLSHEIDEAMKQLAKMEKHDKNDLKKKISDLEQEYNSMEQKKLRKKHLEETKNNANNQLSSTILEKQNIEKKIQDIESKISTLKSKLKDKEELHSRLLGYKQKRDNVLRKLSMLKQTIAQSKESIEAIKDKSICPLCRQPLTPEHKSSLIINEEKRQEQAEQEIRGLNEALTSIDSAINQIEEEIKEQEKQYAAIESYKEQLSLLNSNSKDNEKKTSMLLEQIKSIDEELKGISDVESYDFESRKKELERLKQQIEEELLRESIEEKLYFKQELIKRNKEEIARLSEAISKDNLEIQELNSMKEALAKQQEEKKRQRDELVAYKDKADSIKERITQASSFINFYKDSLNKLNDEIEKKEKAKEKAQKLNAYEDFFSDTLPSIAQSIETSVLSKILSDFSQAFEEWFDQLVESEDIQCTIDDEFSPRIRINDYDSDVTSLSGGEKTSVALAYRLALNKVINDVANNVNTKDLLILDEPTDGFSSEQLDKVRDILDALDMRQIIIVSHESKMESYVDKIIRISKNEGATTVFSY